MPNAKNTQLVADLSKKVADAKAIIFADYSGLDANNINALRQTMKDSDAEVVVAKNTLLNLALKEQKIDTTQLSADLKGATAVIFSYNDAVATIKTLYEYIKKIELPKIKSALFEGSYNTGSQIEIISKLPSRQQLLTTLAYTLKSPITRFVAGLNNTQQKFVYTISAIAEQKKGGAK